MLTVDPKRDGPQAGVRAAVQETFSFSQTGPITDEAALNILLNQCARFQIPQRATPEMAPNWRSGAASPVMGRLETYRFLIGKLPEGGRYGHPVRIVPLSGSQQKCEMALGALRGVVSSCECRKGGSEHQVDLYREF